jgi:hypothetical protein
MRLMVTAFVVAIALIVDQLRFAGYYRRSVIDIIDRGTARTMQMARGTGSHYSP